MTADFLFGLLVGLTVGGIGAAFYVNVFIGGFLYAFMAREQLEEEAP